MRFSMTLKHHRQVSELLKNAWRVGVYADDFTNIFDALRCTLDSWMLYEYPTEEALPSSELKKYYYGLEGFEFHRRVEILPEYITNAISDLKHAESILVEQYEGIRDTEFLSIHVNKMIIALKKYSNLRFGEGAY